MDCSKFWSNIIDFVPYEEGYEEINSYPEEAFLTRKEWNGVHYINRHKEYCILLKNGEIIINPIEVFKMDEPDWILVEVDEKTMKLIKQHSSIFF